MLRSPCEKSVQNTLAKTNTQTHICFKYAVGGPVGESVVGIIGELVVRMCKLQRGIAKLGEVSLVQLG